MKKILISIMIIMMIFGSACSQNSIKTSKDTSKEAETITYKSENGPIKVPAHPKRIVALNGSTSGDIMKLGGNIVGVEKYSMANPLYKKYLKNATVVSDEDLEKIIELKPDLIIAGSTDKNLDKLSKIAPTVSYTYNKLGYLDQVIEIGKLINKKKQAQEWVNNFKKRASDAGEKIKNKIGNNSTVTILGGDNKQLYVFGSNWGRGSEILYQAMGLKMPAKVTANALKPGYYVISSEVLPQYIGDYLIYIKDSAADNSFQNTDTYKNIPAVKNNRVLEVDANKFYFNDPISLDYELDTFINYFLGNSK
ncbi:iron complex transport system substrate-binding protein [Clostridium acetobutylicum]|uniref:Ferrichrome-binding periplasmic proteinl, fhuD n=1 Tax=Clostridium acetobutylicum (strain ATCC 824 / DSM 792 / JCM 1419 / IAM 19013 / LMG 5710 / NBRC 13948 / NRRL B-527 / VKM B-1787 / 2291 / W) TaxID=272562 RepID=Q97KX6_CLOAB|nr:MULTISPECIES: ABC transporter substrate-binding protein [Clostridium]AAK78766.1 Ferrichrome-binding periplasmic proteinl, fhuD [Clostridium acetobutylicum ATCC 824]ADZ19840.1 Ferrichrome-binding periplasmic proteinl, fhuD [Clostridium acetobutylicum EA 2018]AEI33872.1 ferrichrome-binding periplasmic proteinl, fhuD [Clostridium acetobutylicum DSM 1731]AWV80484.1 ABC transporter substrate-binding protein [Clostridium acetobutylicum]MBC2392674.1 iron-hydroxamate ABC transporter substrate-bindi